MMMRTSESDWDDVFLRAGSDSWVRTKGLMMLQSTNVSNEYRGVSERHT